MIFLVSPTICICSGVGLLCKTHAEVQGTENELLMNSCNTLGNIFLGSIVDLYGAEEKKHRRLLCYVVVMLCYAVKVEIAMPVTVLEKNIFLLQVSVYFH